MNSFPLKVVTPDGMEYDGTAEQLIVRTTSGDLGILAGHINCVAPLGMGRAIIVSEGKRRIAACIGGMLTVIDGEVTLAPTTFEWADEIDVPRAALAESRARELLSRKNVSALKTGIAEARLKRALVRQSVAKLK